MGIVFIEKTLYRKHSNNKDPLSAAAGASRADSKFLLMFCAFTWFTQSRQQVVKK